MSKIYNIYGDDAFTMTLELLKASKAISLVPEDNKTVALKPNLVVAGRPENGATTHAEILSACIEYFRANGIQDISIIEGSWVGDDTTRAMKRAGYDLVCEKYKVPFYDLKRDKVKSVRTHIGNISICERALNAGLLVNLPVLKGHCQTVMTCALKNLKGCLPDNEKRRFHSLGLTKPIAALGAVMSPRLNIVDSICGDLSFEEGGNPIFTNRMFLGFDPVQVDAYGCNLMGLDLEDVPYIKLAQVYGAGNIEIKNGDVINLNAPENSNSYPRPSGTVKNLTRFVSEDSACSACYASLVRALHVNSDGRNLKICIGQGWRGKEFDGLGIGNCCKNAKRNVPGCPPTAAEIAQAF